MKLRTLITSSIILTSAVAISACDMDMDGHMAAYDETIEMPANSASTCISARPDVSDAWCQAVDCAPVYIDGGYCQLADEAGAPAPRPEETLEIKPAFTEIEDTGTCISAARHVSDAWCQDVKCAPVYIEQGLCKLVGANDNTEVEPTPEVIEEREVVTKPASSRAPYYPHWGKSVCVNDGKQPSWQTALYDDGSDCCAKHFSWNIQACLDATGARTEPTVETPEDVIVPEDNDENNDDAADENDDDAPVVEDDEDDETPVIDDEEDDAAMTDDNDDDTLADDTCPAGWNLKSKNCEGLTWRNSVLWLCLQTLPSAVTPTCDSDDLEDTDEMCVLGFGPSNHSAEWCENPHAPLICGGNVCDVPAKGNSCDFGGPQNTFSFCP